MVVTTCPCRQQHNVSDDIWASYQRVTEGLTPDVNITVAGRGTWHVPRIYIACHAVRGIEIPGLARHYGWPEVVNA